MIHETIRIWPKGEYRGAKGFEPTLDTYVLDGAKTRPALLICPGGAYAYTSLRESEPIALQFNAAGFHAFVLHYSVAPARYPLPFLDVARAMCLLREDAAQWRLRPDAVALCGFSAGGHLAASLAFMGDSSRLLGVKGIEPERARPDALVLAYPVISSGEFAHRGSFDNLLGPDPSAELLEETSLERRVTEAAPPSFIWHTFDDDAVPVENSLLLASALRAKGSPFELHVFPSGPHGLSLATAETKENARGDDPHIAIWMRLCIEWLKGLWA